MDYKPLYFTLCSLAVGAGDFNGDGIDEIVTTNMFTHSATVFPGQAGAMPQNGQEMVVDVTNLANGQLIDDFNNFFFDKPMKTYGKIVV